MRELSSHRIVCASIIIALYLVLSIANGQQAESPANDLGAETDIEMENKNKETILPSKASGTDSLEEEAVDPEQSQAEDVKEAEQDQPSSTKKPSRKDKEPYQASEEISEDKPVAFPVDI